LYFGVDIISSKRGPLVLEVNSSPGLEGIEKSTGVNIAKEIMLYIEHSLKLKSKLKRKRNINN
jgi:ribosomal protein S6--L-glutamate ligase